MFVKEDPLGNPVDRSIPGTRPRFPSRKNATSRELYLGDVTAMV